jgi:hypothetical protein
MAFRHHRLLVDLCTQIHQSCDGIVQCMVDLKLTLRTKKTKFDIFELETFIHL